jgi:hypothetical protein
MVLPFCFGLPESSSLERYTHPLRTLRQAPARMITSLQDGCPLHRFLHRPFTCCGRKDEAAIAAIVLLAIVLI